MLNQIPYHHQVLKAQALIGGSKSRLVRNELFLKDTFAVFNINIEFSEVGKTENNVALIPSKESEIAELATKFPPAPTKPGVTTEKITKTTYTEQTVQRVTTNEVKPKIEVPLPNKSY